VLWLLAAFAAITLVGFSIIAVVQLAFKRGLGMGFVRSVRFAGWIINVLAMQAQIGRTATSGQPPLLKGYYDFLKIFEFNTDGARPLQCSGSTGTAALTAMSVSLGAALVAAILGLPCVGALLVKTGDALAVRVVSVLRKGRATTLAQALTRKKQGQTEGGNEFDGGASSAGGSDVELTSLARGRSDTFILPTQSNPLALDVTDATSDPLDRKYSRTALLSIRYYRTKRDEEVLATKEGRRAKKKRVAQEKKITKKASAKPKKNHGAAFVLGTVRKMLTGTVLLIHPLVANLAFSAVYCVQLGGAEGTPENGYRVASDLTKLCFEGDHLPVFILACFAIAITIVGFPIVLLVQLSRSSDCFGCGRGCAACSEKANGVDDRTLQPRAVPSADSEKAEEEFAPSGGLCCRNAMYMRCVTRNRIAMDEHHSKVSRRDDVVERYEAYSSLTHAEYKPEYFWVRCVC
jgi:hypothetical protein